MECGWCWNFGNNIVESVVMDNV